MNHVFTLDFFVDFIGGEILPEHRQNGFFFPWKGKVEFALMIFLILSVSSKRNIFFIRGDVL
jgi:hypothetical protein